MNTLITHACIVTMNEKMEVIRDGSLLIENGRISRIGYGITASEGAAVFDAGGMIVMPGLINAHTHLPMTLLRGYADDLPLDKWLTEHIFPAEARLMTPENVRIGTRLALLEMIKTGTTCFNDMYYFEDVIAEEAKKAGIRGVMGEALIDFPTVSFATVDEGCARAERLLSDWQGDNTIHPSVCAHAPYTCSPETLQKAKKLADKYNTILHIHAAETREEVEQVTTRHGLPPVEYLHSLGLTGKNVITAHAVWLNAVEVDMLADTGTAVAHNPKSNLKLASGIAPVASYLQSGITVAIGTDGAASNNTLDMVEEMRFAALISKGETLNPEAVGAREALQMVTIHGARALGLGDRTGSLEEGKCADLIFVDPGSYNMLPMHDPLSALVYAMNSHNIRHAIVNGEWIMRERRVLHLDEEEIIASLRKIFPH